MEIILTIKKNILLVLLLTVLNLATSTAQNYFGVTGGVNAAKLLDFSKDEDYDSKYHIKSGSSFYSFFETTIDTTSNFKVELQYQYQMVGLDVKYNAGHGSFYKNLNLNLQQLRLNCIYSIQLLHNKSWQVYFSLGPTLAYTLNTKSKGSGWEYSYETKLDTNNNPIQVLTLHNWTKDENKSKDISQLNLGFVAGFDLAFPISNRLDFLVQNRYTIFLTNVTTLDRLTHTSILSGGINLGLRLNLQK